MDTIRKSLKNYFTQPDFGKRTFIMMLGVVSMGFWLAFLIRAGFGTDPCTFMNLTVANKLGILFGTWQLILNTVLFLLVILFGRNHIGLGTLANMTLIGYIADFVGWIIDKNLPARYFQDLTPRIIFFIVSFSFFIVSAAFYMNANMGVAPYDAIPMMVKKYLLKGVPFTLIRIVYDYTAILIGILCGGRPTIGVLLMALFLGPVITTVGKFLNKHVFHLS